jgi:hypothetical protein
MAKKSIKEVEVKETAELPGGTITDPGFYVKCVKIADGTFRYPDATGNIALNAGISFPNNGYVVHTLSNGSAILYPDERGIVDVRNPSVAGKTDKSYYVKGYVDGGDIKFAGLDGVLDLS